MAQYTVGKVPTLSGVYVDKNAFEFPLSFPAHGARLAVVHPGGIAILPGDNERDVVYLYESKGDRIDSILRRWANEGYAFPAFYTEERVIVYLVYEHDGELVCLLCDDAERFYMRDDNAL